MYSGSYNHVNLFLHFGYLKVNVKPSEACAEGDEGCQQQFKMLDNSLWSLSAQVVSYSWLHWHNLSLVDIVEKSSFSVWIDLAVLLEILKLSCRLASGMCLFLRSRKLISSMLYICFFIKGGIIKCLLFHTCDSCILWWHQLSILHLYSGAVSMTCTYVKTVEEKLSDGLQIPADSGWSLCIWE